LSLRFAGTVIRHDCKASNLPIKGISSINNISILNLEGSGMVGKSGFSGRLFSLLAREQINIILITQSSSEHSITFAVQPNELIRPSLLIEQEFELELLANKLEPLGGRERPGHISRSWRKHETNPGHER
jgi:aspartokinase/homoserine dehydrogenase 1